MLQMRNTYNFWQSSTSVVCLIVVKAWVICLQNSCRLVSAFNQCTLLPFFCFLLQKSGLHKLKPCMSALYFTPRAICNKALLASFWAVYYGALVNVTLASTAQKHVELHSSILLQVNTFQVKDFNSNTYMQPKCVENLFVLFKLILHL